MLHAGGDLADELTALYLALAGSDTPLGEEHDGPVTYIGLRRPDGLPEGSRIVTPENLRDLIPA